MRIRRKPLDASAQGDMTPMIDMTFQLIAFFMVLINFSDIEQDQRINLPLSELAKPPDTAYLEPLTVQMTKDDTVLFAGEEFPVDALQAALLREAQILRAYDSQKLRDVTVIIRADQDVEMGRVQEVIAMCQKAEFDTFALRGRQSEKPFGE
jgi:biopolymer transport protein ExbD